jgi:hypothetical protein
MDEPLDFPPPIPPELLEPTVEELDRRNREDQLKTHRARKRPGKKERLAKKTEAERAKFLQFAQEYDKGKTEVSAAPAPAAPVRVLRGSFGAVKGSAGVAATATIFDPNAPTPEPPPRRRGRPPKIRPLF